MHRWTDLSQVPDGFGPSVVTIGNFDGVHRGHRSVLSRMVADAHHIGGASIAVTFDPHPAQVHSPGSAPPLIDGLADRLELLGQTGIDAVLVIRYTLEFAAAYGWPESIAQDGAELVRLRTERNQEITEGVRPHAPF